MFILDYRENQKKRKGVLLIAVAFKKHLSLFSLEEALPPANGLNHPRKFNSFRIF